MWGWVGFVVIDRLAFNRPVNCPAVHGGEGDSTARAQAFRPLAAPLQNNSFPAKDLLQKESALSSATHAAPRDRKVRAQARRPVRHRRRGRADSEPEGRGSGAKKNKTPETAKRRSQTLFRQRHLLLRIDSSFFYIRKDYVPTSALPQSDAIQVTSPFSPGEGPGMRRPAYSAGSVPAAFPARSATPVPW